MAAWPAYTSAAGHGARRRLVLVRMRTVGVGARQAMNAPVGDPQDRDRKQECDRDLDGVDPPSDPRGEERDQPLEV